MMDERMDVWTSATVHMYYVCTMYVQYMYIMYVCFETINFKKILAANLRGGSSFTDGGGG